MGGVGFGRCGDMIMGAAELKKRIAWEYEVSCVICS